MENLIKSGLPIKYDPTDDRSSCPVRTAIEEAHIEAFRVLVDNGAFEEEKGVFRIPWEMWHKMMHWKKFANGFEPKHTFEQGERAAEVLIERKVLWEFLDNIDQKTVEGCEH